MNEIDKKKIKELFYPVSVSFKNDLIIATAGTGKLAVTNSITDNLYFGNKDETFYKLVQSIKYGMHRKIEDKILNSLFNLTIKSPDMGNRYYLVNVNTTKKHDIILCHPESYRKKLLRRVYRKDKITTVLSKIWSRWNRREIK